MASTKPVKITRQTISDIPDNVDPNMYIPVRNGYHGILVYESSKTHEVFIWNEFGDTQEMELKELRNAKNTMKTFFVNNYFMFDEEYSWVIKYLGVTEFYKNAIGIDGFDELFTKSPNEIKNVVSTMSDGQKKSLYYCVKEKISNGEIDSFRTIKALEESLGTILIDKDEG